jgi:NAD(P)-dependent dehydrogenase (short-subunit alcohol dehydrogenase family)
LIYIGVVGLMRALKQECAKLHISISVVAPAITVTPIITSPSSAESPEQRAEEMAKHGVPINRPDSVALAVCWLINEGMAANGAGVFVQADRFVDLERGLAKTRAGWMTKEMLDLFRGGRTAKLFERLEVEEKGKL